VARFEAALKLALDGFLASGAWPERERFRRGLVQRELDVSLDDLIHEMPKSPWESRQFPPDKIVLSLQVLQHVAGAQPLLDVCVAMTRRAYALYRADDDDQPVLHSDDPVLLAAAGGDEHLLMCAREVLGQHPPSPLGGGTSGAGTTEWTCWLNEATLSGFKDITSIEDYLAAQQRIISADPYRRSQQRSALPVSPFAGLTTPPAQPQSAQASPGSTEIFVIMPFSEPWRLMQNSPR
jgi:hypothetical protein